MKRLFVALLLALYCLGLGVSVVDSNDSLAVNWNSRHTPHGQGNGNGNGNGGGNGNG